MSLRSVSYFVSVLALLSLVMAPSMTMADLITVPVPVPNGDFSLPTEPASSTTLGVVPTDWLLNVGAQGALMGIGADAGGNQYFVNQATSSAYQYLLQTNIGTNVVGPGITYTLECDYANSGTKTAEIVPELTTNNGATLLSPNTGTNFYVIPAGGTGWTPFSISGTTTAANTGPLGVVFKFYNWNGSGVNLEVDNVAISYQTQTPEPGTLVLLATGLLGLAAYAWRRRK